MHELHDQAESAARAGDAAGEHLYMQRGQYSAWAYVIVAALLQGVLAMAVLHGLLEAAGFFGPAALGVAGALSVGLAVGTFWDRWRVVEAFSSRFCVGIVNISLFIAVPAALLYANARLLLRLVRRESWLIATTEPSPGAWR
jgi:uncharacterized membrane protein YeaQ/YmgE (transglycosylase-associated protein family)